MSVLPFSRPPFTLPFWQANLVNLMCLSGATMFVLLPLYLEAHGMPRWEIGLVAGAFSLVSVFARPWVGARLDQRGRRQFFIQGACLQGLLALAWLAFPPSLGLTLVVRGMQGVAMAFYFTAMWTWIADFAPEGRRAEVMGFFGISGLVSGAAGPVLAEAALSFGGFESVFGLAGGLALGGALLARRLGDQMPESLGPPPEAREFWHLGWSRNLQGTTLGAVAFGISSGTLLAFAAPFVASQGHSGVGVFFTVYNVASVSVRLFAGRLADRVGAVRVVAPALLCQALGLGLLSRLEPGGWLGAPALWGAAVLGGMGHGLIYPALSSLAVRRVGAARRGMGVSLFTAAVEFGAFAGATTSGLLAHLAGYPSTFLGVACVVFVVSLVHRRLERGEDFPDRTP